MTLQQEAKELVEKFINFCDPELPCGDHSLYELLPATEEEYNNYKTTHP